MNTKTTITILLISFFIACFIVEDSQQVISVLKSQYKAVKPRKPSKPRVTNVKKPSTKRPTIVNGLPFKSKKPDRYSEGPIQDTRSFSRFYNY